MVFSKETGNLELIPNLCHLEWCKRFARVLGITDEEIANPEWLAESSWIEKAFSEGRWQAVAAFIMVGFEANIPRTFRIYVSALKEHYGFKDDDLEFFQKHIVADEIHGQAGAKLLDEWAQDDKERSEILLGVKRGALSWWLMHKTMDKEMRKQEMAPQSP